MRWFPDVVVLKDRKPWVLIELKESRRLGHAALRERSKLETMRKKLMASRAYLLHIGRRGAHKALRGAKKSYGYWFFEIPISLERAKVPLESIKEWETKFRKLAKCTIPSRLRPN